jgi:hypothetical protein
MNVINFLLLGVALIFSTSGKGLQESVPQTSTFANHNLAFEYPAKWKLAAQSTPTQEYAVIAPDGISQIRISFPKGSGSCDFQADVAKIEKDVSEKLAREIHATSPIKTSASAGVEKAEINGLQFQGQIGSDAVTGETYTFRLKRRFVNLTFIETSKGELATSAWAMVRNSLQIKPSDLGEITNGVLSGRAIALPRPAFSPVAAQAHISGDVLVQVTINEEGKVVSAQAIEGHQLLRPASVAAAEAARFAPTMLCNEPVKITGVLSYHFVRQ